MVMVIELIGGGDSFCLSFLDLLLGLLLEALLGLTSTLLGFTFTLLGFTLGNLFLWSNKNCSLATKYFSFFDFCASNLNLS